MAEFVVYTSFEEMVREESDQPFVHYFISSRIYFEHTQFFRERPHKSIVLVNGDMMISGVFTLNVCQSEASLVHDILQLQTHGHHAHPSQTNTMMAPPDSMPHHKPMASEQILSAREIEVAILLCKGLINKEIADKLSISTTTVISHRKNIMEKLQARSLADIIIYSVMNGLVSVEEL